MAETRDVINALLASRLANPGLELAKTIHSQGTWTAVVRGSGTAGTYEIASQDCSYFRFGNRVWVDVRISMAAVITGGGTGDLIITGMPFSKRSNHTPIGTAAFDIVNYTNNALLHMLVHTDPATLYFDQTNDAGANTALPISAATANVRFAGSLSFEIAS